MRGLVPRLFVPLLASLLAAHASGADEATRAVSPTAPHRVWAIWVTRWDYRTADDIRAIVANCASLGLNRLFFQVRGQADAFYRSSLEPWGEELGDKPGFDPLETALVAARQECVELHAWINLLPGWKGAKSPKNRNHLVHTHPDWFLMDQAGRRRVLDASHYTLLNPCLPAVRDHLRAVASDIAKRYAVDGVQLDYVRFLDRDARNGEEVPFDSPTLASFRSAHGATPAQNPRAWDQFRLRAIDQLVEEVSAAIRAARPGCSVSVAAIRDPVHARAHLFQDAPLWLEKGWVSEVYPMVYERTQEAFERRLAQWRGLCPPNRIAIGVGAHLFAGPPPIASQLRAAHAPGGPRLAGFCLFAYSDFFKSCSPESRDGEAPERRRTALQAFLKAALLPKDETASR